MYNLILEKIHTSFVHSITKTLVSFDWHKKSKVSLSKKIKSNSVKKFKVTAKVDTTPT